MKMICAEMLRRHEDTRPYTGNGRFIDVGHGRKKMAKIKVALRGKLV